MATGLVVAGLALVAVLSSATAPDRAHRGPRALEKDAHVESKRLVYADTDGDGTLSLPEYTANLQGLMSADEVAVFFMMIDKDGDGHLSAAEVEGKGEGAWSYEAVRFFAGKAVGVFDNDGDRHLSPMELMILAKKAEESRGGTVPPGPPPQSLVDSYMSTFDLNGDGRVSVGELSAAYGVGAPIRRAFALADADADGTVTPLELAAELAAVGTIAGPPRPIQALTVAKMLFCGAGFRAVSSAAQLQAVALAFPAEAQVRECYAAALSDGEKADFLRAPLVERKLNGLALTAEPSAAPIRNAFAMADRDADGTVTVYELTVALSAFSAFAGPPTQLPAMSMVKLVFCTSGTQALTSTAQMQAMAVDIPSAEAVAICFTRALRAEEQATYLHAAFMQLKSF